MFSESGRHQSLPIYHSWAMTEPVYRDTVVLSSCPVVTCEYVGHLMFSLHIERLLSLALTLASSLSYQSGVVVCGHYFVVMRHCMLAHCNAVPFVLSSLFVNGLLSLKLYSTGSVRKVVIQPHQELASDT